MTEQPDHQNDQGQRERRPFGFRPRLVPTAEGHALGELTAMYAEGQIDPETIARIMNEVDSGADGDRTMKSNTLGVLDALLEQGEMDEATHRRLRDAVERAAAEGDESAERG